MVQTYEKCGISPSWTSAEGPNRSEGKSLKPQWTVAGIMAATTTEVDIWEG